MFHLLQGVLPGMKSAGSGRVIVVAASTSVTTRAIGRPDDIGWLAVYLASDESSWVTAADISIDGGATAW